MRKRGRGEEAAEVTAAGAEEIRTTLSAKPPQARLSIAERKRLKKAKAGQPNPKTWRTKPVRCGAAAVTPCNRIDAFVCDIVLARRSLDPPRATRGPPAAADGVAKCGAQGGGGWEGRRRGRAGGLPADEEAED
jgi:hypothetical protein